MAGGLAWALVLGGWRPGVGEGLDFVRLVAPYQEFFRESILRGELPWWNPYASLGRPFLADLQALGFYPATWLVLPFGVMGGWFVAATLHGALGLWGFFRLGASLEWSRVVALLAGLAFLFSGPLVARMQAGQVNYVYGLCYVPLILHLALSFARLPTRRGWVALAVVWALQLLCGHPQVFWLTALATGLWVTGALAERPWGLAWSRWWRASAGLVTAFVTGLALLGFILWPFLQLVAESNRAQLSLAFSGAFGMQPVHWLSLFTAPRATFAINWEYDLHVGLPVCLAGVLGFSRLRDPVARGALLLALGGAVIAAGNATPFFAALFDLLPGLASFRVPARAGVLLVLGLIVSAGALTSAWPPARRPRWAMPAVALVVFAGVLLALKGWKALPGAGAVFPAEQLVHRALVERHLDQDAAPPRVAVPGDVLRENSGMIFGYATPVGFESLSLARVWNYLHVVADADPAHSFNTSPDGRFYDVAPRVGSLNLAVSMPRDSSALTVKAPADSRAYLVSRWREVPDWRAAELAMARGHPIHEEALVESAFLPIASDSSPGTAGTAWITRFHRNVVEVAVDAAAPCLLVLAEAWYPRWQARVDGVDTKCLPANGWMRAVPVPAGRHVVRFEYRETRFLPGCALSLATVGLIWFVGRRRHPPA